MNCQHDDETYLTDKKFASGTINLHFAYLLNVKMKGGILDADVM